MHRNELHKEDPSDWEEDRQDQSGAGHNISTKKTVGHEQTAGKRLIPWFTSGFT